MGKPPLLLLSALTALGALSIDMYLPAMPTIAQDLGCEIGAVQASLGWFFAGFAVGQLAWGPLSDRYGRKPPLMAGLALYAMASLICGFVENAPILAAARFLQALGACSGPVIARAMIRDIADRDGIARLLSTVTMVMGLAPLAAPIMGSEILWLIGWRAIFWFLALIAVLVLCAAALMTETLATTNRRSLSLVGLARDYGGLFIHRGFISATVTAGCVWAGMFAYITAAPFVFVSFYHLGPTVFSLIFGSNVAGLILVAWINRQAVPKIGSPLLLKLGLGVNCAATGLLCLVALDAGHPWYWLVPPLFLAVSSISLIGANATAAALHHVARNAGAGSALLGFCQFSLAAVVSDGLAAFDAETALPMAAVMLGLALVATLVHGLFGLDRTGGNLRRGG